MFVHLCVIRNQSGRVRRQRVNNGPFQPVTTTEPVICIHRLHFHFLHSEENMAGHPLGTNYFPCHIYKYTPTVLPATHLSQRQRFLCVAPIIFLAIYIHQLFYPPYPYTPRCRRTLSNPPQHLRHRQCFLCTVPLTPKSQTRFPVCRSPNTQVTDNVSCESSP